MRDSAAVSDRARDPHGPSCGILFVLHTGIHWEYLPQELGFGCGMICWRRFAAWNEAGVWDQLQSNEHQKPRQRATAPGQPSPRPTSASRSWPPNWPVPPSGPQRPQTLRRAIDRRQLDARRQAAKEGAWGTGEQGGQTMRTRTSGLTRRVPDAVRRQHVGCPGLRVGSVDGMLTHEQSLPTAPDRFRGMFCQWGTPTVS
ncbi:hypothetical protein GCM10023323_16370 [Streptomyces thinghirensis]|uniref:Insertion element IS402-like domain-containing protein n=1 Tax=Streptomyces thinghirensis TaxID=551547 RepID=A0ABP9SXR2_9ACTN